MQRVDVIVSNAETILRTKIIEKAWADPAFKQQLLADPKAALKAAFGVSIPDNITLKAVEEKANELVLVIPPNPAEILSGKAQPVGIW
jgi:hypothetical protein